VGEEIGPVLVSHPDVDLIAFTCSQAVGLGINETAAHTDQSQGSIRRVIAELGGKNAIIVDDDANLDEAVVGVIQSAFGYAGQKCSACSRVIVVDGAYDEFTRRLHAAVASVVIGAADQPGTFVGPVIDAESRQRIEDYIAVGEDEGRLLVKGDAGKLADQGFFVAPHVFVDLSPESRLAQEEIFGPVLVVLRARDFSHALELANGTRFALTGGVYSRSPVNLKRARQEFEVGNLYLNRSITGAMVQRHPFGGYKMSGIGSKAGGPDYLLQFLVPVNITENTLRRGFAPGEGGASGKPKGS
jgi:RHH-type proline utilization regulon transcriptional repressor/proline dehydrogenase/delta 1-pyrroline-5-carboxylate dehydrogenase